MEGKTILAQSSDPTVGILWIVVAFSILKLFFSSLFLYGVMKNKAVIIQAYILYRYILIVLNIILQIYALVEHDIDDSESEFLGYMVYGGELVVGVILSLYSIFLFIIQYNVLKQGNLSGSHSNPAYIDY